MIPFIFFGFFLICPSYAQNFEDLSDVTVNSSLSENFTSIQDLNTVFELHPKQYAEFPDENLAITFLGILEDSRCPTDVTCIWQGRATLSFSMSQVVITELVLNTLDKNTETAFGKYHVELIDVKPFPISTILINNDDYTAVLRISKMSHLDPISPKKQVAQGIEPAAVECSEGKILVLKFHDNSPACVNMVTVDVLYERGWGAMPPPCCKK